MYYCMLHAAALSPAEISQRSCDENVSGMSPEALAEWLVKEIGELYQTDIDKLKGS